MTKSTKAPVDQDLEVGRTIRQIRETQGVSQSALGEAVGVTFQQIQKYEKGRNRVAAGRLQQIADALEVPISTFFDLGEAPPASEQFSKRALEVARLYDGLGPRDKRAVDSLIRTLADRS